MTDPNDNNCQCYYGLKESSDYLLRVISNPVGGYQKVHTYLLVVNYIDIVTFSQ